MFRLTSLLKTVSGNLINLKSARSIYCSGIQANMKLSDVCSKLEEFGSLSFAESWDNVGLLVEPTDPQIDVKKILLTNDLTEEVIEEATDNNVNLIISYHPPIFQGLKRLTSSHWKQRIIVKAIENKIAIYSPHTVWDSVKDGTSEWLANSVPNKSMVPVVPNVNNNSHGAGRFCQVEGNLSLKEIVDMVKKHTGVNDLRIGLSGSLDAKIKNFACCPGSGASVLKEIKQQLDLFITGEMSHHEILEATSCGTNVIILNHSNSERGYLKHFSPILKNLLGNNDVNILISQKDADPLQTV